MLGENNDAIKTFDSRVFNATFNHMGIRCWRYENLYQSANNHFYITYDSILSIEIIFGVNMQILYRFDLLSDGSIIKMAIISYEKVNGLRNYCYKYKDKGNTKYVHIDHMDKFKNNRVYTFEDNIEYVKDIILHTLNDKLLYYTIQKENTEDLISSIKGK